MFIGGDILPQTFGNESPIWIPTSGGGGFVPTDIAGCMMWLDASQLSLSNGDPVSTWTDFSGNGNNATSIITFRPTFTTGGLNGLPVVNFSGANLMNFPNLSAMTAAAGFIVYKNATNGDGNRLWELSSSLNPVTYAPFSGNGLLYDSFFTDTRKDAITASDLASGWNILEPASSNSVWEAYVNGVQVYTTASNTVAAPSAGIFGGASGAAGWSGGDIAEFILYDSVLSSGNRIQVESYLQSKYAL